MKIMFAVRLFSGLQASVSSGIWKPSGAPTIYKLIEALDRSGHDLDLVFTGKEEISGLDTGSDRVLRIDGLAADVSLLAGEVCIPAWIGRFRWYLHEYRQAHKLLRRARDTKPDLIYVDRGNLWAASLLARHQRAPVVYRVMGISPGLKDALGGNHPRQILNRRQLASPFGLVICSVDGSGGEIWLDQMLDASVTQVHLINGVDMPAEHEPLGNATSKPDNAVTTVLFVGRLDPMKGCDEFVSAFLAAYRQAPDSLRAIIVGDGARAQDLRQRVASAHADNAVTFTGALKHRDVHAQYRNADIYVSLNSMGNLSNANLEAMRAGCCAIFPAQQIDAGIDMRTAELFSNDTVFRIPDVGDTDSLAQAILYLHRQPDERKTRATAIYRIAEKLIPSWQERVDSEIRLLEDLGTKPTRGNK